jgi:hypothetical protein
MRVSFFYQFTTPGSEKYLHIAKNLLESVRATMPGVEVWQLTDATSETLPGVDGVKRIEGGMPMGLRRVTAQGQCVGDWLFVDSDVVIRKDVRDVFDSQFDIAVTDRKGTEMEGTPYGRAMPYNNGVVFSRSPAFWDAAKATLLRLPPRLQEWEGEQHVLCHLAKHDQFTVKVLPGRIFNFPPTKDGDVSHAAILHYKGVARKSQLLPVEVCEWKS